MTIKFLIIIKKLHIDFYFLILPPPVGEFYLRMPLPLQLIVHNQQSRRKIQTDSQIAYYFEG